MSALSIHRVTEIACATYSSSQGLFLFKSQLALITTGSFRIGRGCTGGKFGRLWKSGAVVASQNVEQIILYQFGLYKL